MMHFGLSDEQRMLQQSVAGVLADACPLDHVRAMDAAGSAASAQVGDALAALGIGGLLVPPDHGGMGLGLLDAAVVAEALGRSVAPTPFVARHVMGPIALMLAGSAKQKECWLPRIASGETRIGVAVQEVVGRRDGASVAFDGERLGGTALFALDAQDADMFVVADAARRLHLVDATAEGLEIVALKTIDSTRSVAELRLADAACEPLCADGGVAAARVRDAGRIMLAADSLGAGDVMLDKAVAYAAEREQFGRVIGSFQAVKHMCAEMAARLEPCRALVWYAAHAFDEQRPEAPLMTCHAKSHLGEVGQFVARTATEVHGGIGFTDLLGLHYWFKRIGFDRQVLGGPETVRGEAAALQGWARDAA